MKLTQIAGVLLAVSLVASAGVAAMPGNAPADSQAGQANDYATDDGERENESDDADEEREEADENETDAENDTEADEADANATAKNDADAAEANAASERRGPPADLPGQAPEFVGEIHDLIRQKLDGTIADLGAQISAITPGEDGSDGEEMDAEMNGEMDADDRPEAAGNASVASAAGQ